MYALWIPENTEFSCRLAAMSSYLFIVKYELPEVIRTFMHLEESSGWASVLFKNNARLCFHLPFSAVVHLFCICSEWYLNGNYLVVFVSVGIILPLSLLKNLGTDIQFSNLQKRREDILRKLFSWWFVEIMSYSLHNVEKMKPVFFGTEI